MTRYLPLIAIISLLIVIGITTITTVGAAAVTTTATTTTTTTTTTAAAAATTTTADTIPDGDDSPSEHQNGNGFAWYLSRGLSLFIITGSVLLKVPQIRNIVITSSGTGLSLIALYFDLISYIANGIYSHLIHAPITTYAEHFIIAGQVIIIIVLVWYYGQVFQLENQSLPFGFVIKDYELAPSRQRTHNHGTRRGVVNNTNHNSNNNNNNNNNNDNRGTFVGQQQQQHQLQQSKSNDNKVQVFYATNEHQIAVPVFLICLIFLELSLPEHLWPVLIVVSSLVSLVGKLTLIVQILRQKHTGVISFITVALQVMGGFVRIVTTLVEVKDMGIVMSYLLSVVLHIVILWLVLFLFAMLVGW
jgi:hypothetical protein